MSSLVFPGEKIATSCQMQNYDHSADGSSWFKLWFELGRLNKIMKYLNCNHMFKKQTDHRQGLNWEHYRHTALKVI